MTRKGGFYYGWLLVFLSALNLFLLYGTRYVFSVAYPVLLDEFGWSRASTALVFSFNFLFYGLTALVAGQFADRLGPKKVISVALLILALALALASRVSQVWQLYLFLGVMAAIGLNASGYLPHSLILNHWFARRRGTALGFLTVGSASASLMGVPFYFLMSHYGWRNAYLVMAALPLLVLPLVVRFLRARPQEMGLLPDGDTGKGADASSEQSSLVLDKSWTATEWTLRRAVKTFRYWALFWTYVGTWGVAWALITAHQVAFFQDVGYSEAFAASVFGLYGVFFGAGNLLGFLCDLIGREKAFTLGWLGVFSGVLLLLLVRDASAPWLLYLYVVLFGLGTGIVVAPVIAAIVDIFGMKNYGSIYGSILAGYAFAGAISTWLAGLIFDLTGKYTLSFYLALIFLAATLFLFWLAAPRKVVAIGRRDRERG